MHTLLPIYHWLCIDPGKNKSDGTSLLRVGVHQAASLPAASNLTHVYGAYVPENSNGSDHTCKGNQVGLDAPFIRNVDENYPSSPGMRLCGYSNHNFQWHRHVLINKMGSSE